MYAKGDGIEQSDKKAVELYEMDSRLSFGSKYYYYHDSSFFIPMERGAITIMEPSSFAANDISHCVRPSDMEGRSAVIVLRHVKQE